MAVTTMTAVGTVPFPGSSPLFINDATGLPCVDFGGNTTSVTITNLNDVSYNSFLDQHEANCGAFIFSPPGYTLFPGVPHTVDLNLLGHSCFAVVIVAQDIGVQTCNIRVEWATPPPNCQFGTQLRPGADVLVSLSVAAITNFLIPVGGEFLGPILGVLAGQILDQGELCSSLPPPMPPISTNLPSESMATWLQLLKHLAWFSVCECVPGTPTPVPPPTPALTQPVPWIVYPTLAPCSNSDPCVQLQELTRAVRNLQQSITNVYELEQLVQRYALPFAYIRGRRFSTLASSGTASINRCVGLLIEVVAHPPGNKTMLGVPPYIFDLGWISVVDLDGMIDEIRLTRQATTWLSKLIPSATQVGWGLREGVTVEISELLAEP